MSYARKPNYEFLAPESEDRLTAGNILHATKIGIQAYGLYHEKNVCMNITETAQFLGICRNTVTARIADGRIQAKALRDRWVIPRIQFLDEVLRQWARELHQFNQFN